MAFGSKQMAALGLVATYLIGRIAIGFLGRKPPPGNAPARRPVGAGSPVWRRLFGAAFEPLEGKAKVLGGDTIRLGESCVRLFGVDAPELEQPGGSSARAHLIRAAEGKTVFAMPVSVDRAGRKVARVWLGTTDLSAMMVRDGYAVAMRDRHRDYLPHEGAARRERRGLWEKDPVNGIGDPAAFRRRRQRQRLLDDVEPRAARPTLRLRKAPPDPDAGQSVPRGLGRTDRRHPHSARAKPFQIEPQSEKEFCSDSNSQSEILGSDRFRLNRFRSSAPKP